MILVTVRSLFGDQTNVGHRAVAGRFARGNFNHDRQLAGQAAYQAPSDPVRATIPWSAR
jgi:hypothetical protein